MRQVDEIDKIAGDNWFYYAHLLYIIQSARGRHTKAAETACHINEVIKECTHPRTGYIVRRDTPDYPNASMLEMSMDEMLAIVNHMPWEDVNQLHRRLIKFRGFYTSHLRNRTFLGGFLGLWCALKLNATGGLSFPWQLALAATVLTTDWKSPGSKLLTMTLIYGHTQGRYNSSFLGDRVVNYAVKRLNKEGVENIMKAYWATSGHPDNVLTQTCKGMVLLEVPRE